MTEKKSGDTLGWVVLLVLFGICAGLYQASLWLDREGYLRHVVSARITAETEWLPGETKQCFSIPLPARVDDDNPKDDVFSSIECDKGPEHQVKVEFYGQQVQPGLKYSATWSCTRNTVSTFNDQAFTCKQTGAF